jgi:hypothetical protein
MAGVRRIPHLLVEITSMPTLSLLSIIGTMRRPLEDGANSKYALRSAP